MEKQSHPWPLLCFFPPAFYAQTERNVSVSPSRPLSPVPLPGFSLIPEYSVPYPIMRTLTPMSSEMSPVLRASQALAQSISSVPCGPLLTNGENERQPAVHPGRSREAWTDSIAERLSGFVLTPSSKSYPGTSSDTSTQWPPGLRITSVQSG